MLNKGKTFRMEVELHRANGQTVVQDMPQGSAPTASCDTTAEIKGKYRYQAYSDGDIDVHYDIVYPYMVVNEVRRLLGKYIITDAQEEGAGLYSFTCMDLCQMARRAKVETRPFYPAGTPYTEVMGSLLVNCGLRDYHIDYTEAVLATDREDWEEGTTHLAIFNQLAGEINFHPLHMRMDGVVQSTQKRLATAENITKVYSRFDYESILLPGGTRIIDAFDHPNKFFYSCENPEMDEVLYAYSENDSAFNRHSVVNAPANPVWRSVDNVPNQAALQAIADAAKYESMISSDEIRFRTWFAPHDPYEIIGLEKDIYVGIVAETGWTMELSKDGSMTHIGKRANYT